MLCCYCTFLSILLGVSSSCNISLMLVFVYGHLYSLCVHINGVRYYLKQMHNSLYNKFYCVWVVYAFIFYQQKIYNLLIKLYGTVFQHVFKIYILNESASIQIFLLICIFTLLLNINLSKHHKGNNIRHEIVLKDLQLCKKRLPALKYPRFRQNTSTWEYVSLLRKPVQKNFCLLFQVVASEPSFSRLIPLPLIDKYSQYLNFETAVLWSSVMAALS